MGTLSSANPRILIADDQPDVVQSLRLLLKNEGYQTDTATSPAEILAAIEIRDFDLALMDLNYARDTTSGEEGLDLLGRVQVLDATLPIVVMTAWGTVELAVEAMRRGARDFVQKPWDNVRLLSIVSTQVELSQALRRGQRLEAENQLLRASDRPAFVAEAPAMQPALQLIARVGPSDANVLITGEHGTGKDVVARAARRIGSRTCSTASDSSPPAPLPSAASWTPMRGWPACRLPSTSRSRSAPGSGAWWDSRPACT